MNQKIVSKDKIVEIINPNLISVYKKKNSNRLVKLNENYQEIEVNVDENSYSYNDIDLSFDKNNNLTIKKANQCYFKEIDNDIAYSLDEDESPKTQIKIDIDPKTYIYGLGDKAAFLNRYGYQYVSWNTDDPSQHNETYRSLYKSINFLLVNRDSFYYGVFYPSSFKTIFDLGKKNCDVLGIVSSQGEYDYFVIIGNSPLEIIKTYSSLVGRTLLTRLKMLGNQQSRWSYCSADEVRSICENYEKYQLPLDYIHLDIDYMKEYANFTVNTKTFPNLKGLSDELKEKGVNLVAIFDAGVKSKRGYFFYDELIKNKYVLTLNNKTYTNEVWPGESIFPNYFDEKCRDYVTQEAITFEEKYGIDGIWCDMNEPASFKGPLPMEVEAKCGDEIIYHQEFHNMYGEYMTRSISKSFTKRNLRPYVITRAAFATSSQFTTAWNGDNQSLWGHLEASLPQVATMNICNFPLDGVDVGGFGNDCTKELLIRWIEANIFSPFLRNHSSINTRMQEPWMFDQETINIYRKMLNLRYELIPYLYDLAYQSHMDGTPIIRPLFVNFKDDSNVKQINDEIMIGDSLLLAPILHQGETKRSVYVPEGRWYNYFTHEVIEGGKYILADIPLDSIYLLVKEGSILPKFKNLTHLNRKEIKEIIFDCSYGDGKYINYEDDGESLNYLSGQINEYQVEVKNKQVNVRLIKNGYESNYQYIYVDNGYEIIDIKNRIYDK